MDRFRIRFDAKTGEVESYVSGDSSSTKNRIRKVSGDLNRSVKWLLGRRGQSTGTTQVQYNRAVDFVLHALTPLTKVHPSMMRPTDELITTDEYEGTVTEESGTGAKIKVKVQKKRLINLGFVMSHITIDEQQNAVRIAANKSLNPKNVPTVCTF